MRYLRLALLFVLALALVLVAMANRAPVPVQLLPADFAALLGLNFGLELPMFLVIFASIIAGLLIGFVWEWLREHKHRALANMRDATSLPKDDVLAILDAPKAK